MGKMLQYLTVLDFSYNENITEIPDVSGVPKLEKLSLKHCKNLTKIHDSVGLLKKLRIFDAANCKNLMNFPAIRMTCLEQFNLSHCSNLEDFPEILGKMEKITELRITGSPIKNFPFSIRNLTRLQKLELQQCGMVSIPSSIVMLPELGSMCVSQCKGFQISEVDNSEKMESKPSNMECLILSSCKISDVLLPEFLTLFANVKDLNLLGNNFVVLNACFKECHFLRNLKLDDCRSLTKVRGIPVKLETLSMKGCRALESLDLTVLPACTEVSHFLKELVLDDSVFLKDIRGLPPNLDHFSAKNCTSLTPSCTRMLLDQEWVGTGSKMFFLPGTKIPEWFTCYTRGGSISFEFRTKFPAISLCLVIEVITTKRPQKDQTMVLSTPILTSIQPLPTEVEKGLTSQPILSVERPWEDVQGETSERLPVDEVRSTVQNDPPVIERYSDSDDPFNLVDEKLSVRDTSLVSVREAVHALELLMIKDLPEVSSDRTMQSQLCHFLNLLSRSSHRKVTVDVKEALDKFRRKAFESFKEFQATIEPVNKLKNFEKQKARIQKETSAAKNRRKDLKNSIKNASLAIEADKSRKEKLELEIANMRKQEEGLLTYVKNRRSLKEQVGALSKEDDDLLAANKGIEDEGKDAEVKQNMLKSTWSTDLPGQLNKIKNNIFGL
ncbi:TMV resistance protein N [Spatholobus suberectus]|nr:TMV resistance protein N [Spatholobus suberectus]